MTIEDFIKIIKKWEGGLSRHTSDSASAHPCPTVFNGHSGWHTNKGITYAVWKAHFGSNNDTRFFYMSDKDWFEIFDQLYFKAVKGHDFKCLNIGCMVAEFAWGSGSIPAVKLLQKACNELGGNLVIDGKIGPHTLEVANSLDPRLLFDKLIEIRREFFISISKGKNSVFLKGWLNRLENNASLFKP